MGTRKARCPVCRKRRRYQNLPTRRVAAPPPCGQCQYEGRTVDAAVPSTPNDTVSLDAAERADVAMDGGA